jgi:exodeoxyribonuclease VII large subunit
MKIAETIFYLRSMLSPIRLSQLSLLVQEAIGHSFALRRFWVIAEIGNHSFYGQKGFHYFDLIESEPATSNKKPVLISKMPAVAWSAGAGQIKKFEAVTAQLFSNNLQVLVEVSVDFHAVYGLKLVLMDIDPHFTLGLLQLQRQATINRLLQELPETVWAEDDEIKTFNQELDFPVVIQRIAIVTSATAAGYEDFMHSLQSNSFGYRFICDPFYTTVQGELNAPELAAAITKTINAAETSGIDYDAVVLIRGGGASTDLLIFDQFEVAAAIAGCPFPVITGIGHQKDETIADLMAHTAVKTPTKAAEFIIQHNHNFEGHISNLQQSLALQAQQVIYRHKIRLQALDALIKKMPAIFLHNRQSQLQSIIRVLKMASPEKNLQRGFAIIKSKGEIIRSADAVAVGDELTIILNGAEIDSLVQSKKPYHGKEFNL